MNNNRIDALLNIIIVISTLIAVGYYFVIGPDPVGVSAKETFCFFTTDSNLLVALTSLLMLVYNFRNVEPPAWVMKLRLMGVTAVSLTIVTVLVFLTWYDYSRGGAQLALALYQKNCFLMHITTPMLAIISFTLLERTPNLTKVDALWGMLPMVIYAVVYLFLVVVTGVWEDWYGFTFGGNYLLTVVLLAAMNLATYAIAVVLCACRRNK